MNLFKSPPDIASGLLFLCIMLQKPHDFSKNAKLYRDQAVLMLFMYILISYVRTPYLVAKVRLTCKKGTNSSLPSLSLKTKARITDRWFLIILHTVIETVNIRGGCRWIYRGGK